MKNIIKAEAAHQTKEKTTTKNMVLAGMFAAVIAIMSQVSIPTPLGIPVTLQTFAVALAGVVLGWRLATISVLVYILTGAVGAPVFHNFTGGLAIVFGKTGGFFWGFLFLCALCGVGVRLKNKVSGMLLGFLGVILCHFCGILQFSFLTKINFAETFKILSILYLPKDILCVILTYVVGRQIQKRLNTP